MTTAVSMQQPSVAVDKKSILICDDDENLGIILRGFLRFSNYNVVLACDGKKGLEALQTTKFDLVVLDVMMPNIDGLQLAKQIPKLPLNSNAPIIFLTAKNQKDDILSGYKVGASDYITKPFDSELLLYKIEAILKHQSPPQSISDVASSDNELPSMQKKDLAAEDIANNCYLFDQYKFVPMLRELIDLKSNEVMHLTPKEASLLKKFCDNEKKLVKKNDLLNGVWGESSFLVNRSMNVFLVKIRKYFKDSKKISIKSIYKVGYKFSVEGGVKVVSLD